MSNKKTTKRALLLSVIALFICVSMLAGTTFAWFTDSVTSGKNVIVAGNLDVELTHTNAVVTNATVEGSTNLFVDKNGDAILWEPGVVVWEDFTVANVGTLALKYQYQLTKYAEVTNGNKSLEDVIKVGYTTNTTATSREDVIDSVATWINISDIADAGELAPGASATDRIVLYWAPTDHDNDYNMNNANKGKVLSIEFGLTLVATQNTVEVDSFDELYDKDATYPTVVETAADFATAIANGNDVILADDVTVTSTLSVAAGKDVTIDLNGNDLSYEVSDTGASAIINNKGTLAITGNGKISYVANNPDLNSIPSYATNTITSTGDLTIGKGVTVENNSDGGASYAVDVQGGSFTLDGGTLKGNRCALRIAKYNADATEFTMNSGVVTAATPAWIQLPGSNFADAPKISVTINGGTFKSTNTSNVDNDILYTYSFGNSYANTSLVINGGEFLGGTVSIGSGQYTDAPNYAINGGTFEYDVLQWSAGSVSTVIHAANN